MVLGNDLNYNSKTCVKRPLKNRQNKDLNDKCSLMNVERIAECSLGPFESGRLPRFYCIIVCFVALRAKSTAMIMAGRSVHLATPFPGQA